jgi:hypothetical protein
MSIISQFACGGHHALPVLQANAMMRIQDGERNLTPTPATIDFSRDIKVQGASAIPPLLFPHKVLQAATVGDAE